MSRISPEKWIPRDVEGLEPNAWEAVRATSNTAVIAGPGAGKTELLAQRACYLLQTGLCPAPKRILAISFKKDAARNLKERVALRASKEEAMRFDSLTFDAFSKGILDRFMQALPKHWLINKDYKIVDFSRNEYEDFSRGLQIPQNFGRINSFQALRWYDFHKNYVLGSPLPADGIPATSPSDWAAEQWWQRNIHGPQETTYVNFPMIGRLAELILRNNPLILKALRLTYQYVFLDEFQDTTHVQYELIKTMFLASRSILSAVGDHKQQIMRWAMALDNPFELFINDFIATGINLHRNYRSSRGLVLMQDLLAKIVDPIPHETEAMHDIAIDGESCTIEEFLTPQQEADYLASVVNEYIESYNLKPRDFAILIKQKVGDFSPLIVETFARHGIKARDESKLQDLLSDNLTQVVLNFLRMATKSSGRGQYWHSCLETSANIKGYDLNSTDVIAFQYEVDGLINMLSKMCASKPNEYTDVERIIDEVINFLGLDNIKAIYREYRQGEWYQKQKEQLSHAIFEQFSEIEEWDIALDSFEGWDSVPIMTIHKSKGLEFHTIFFVALEDSTWWSFRGQPEETKSAFFVAFSRAKQRVFFTYCISRSTKQDIDSLYITLSDAGVTHNQHLQD